MRWSSNTISEIFVPASQATGETGFILIPSSDVWKLLLPALLPNRQPVEIFRRPHDFDINLFKHHENLPYQFPPYLQLKPIDEPTAKNIPITTSCSSLADFFTNGIGYMLFKNGEFAATCVSLFSSSEKVGLDVRTQEKFRRQGLAELVRYAIIEKCLKSGKSPNWECFWNKEPSLKLANFLGFVKREKYPVYYWEE
jgi:hypothetical protein